VRTVTLFVPAGQAGIRRSDVDGPHVARVSMY
jgi:hypothetical protein